MNDPVEILRDVIAVIDRTKAQLEAALKLMDAAGGVSFTEASKLLKVDRRVLLERLAREGWIYRSSRSDTWLGYKSREDAGLLMHRTVRRHQPDGPDKIFTQCLITSKGLAKLAAQDGANAPGAREAEVVQ